MKIRSKTPCCSRLVILDVQDVPKEKYERACSCCGFGWTIERTPFAGLTKQGVRVDKLVWSMDTLAVREM